MSKAYMRPEAPGRVHSEVRALPKVKEAAGMGKPVAKSCLPVLIIGWKSEGKDHYQGYFFLGLWHLFFSPKWWVHVLVQGVWFPSRLPLEGNWSYPEFWAVTGDPWYPGYLTLTIPVLLCKMEKKFPPEFFNPMQHLQIHLHMKLMWVVLFNIGGFITFKELLDILNQWLAKGKG
jgi:hypothetical protein